MTDGAQTKCIKIKLAAGDLVKAQEVGRQSIKSIDAYHKEFKKNHWLERQELECLIDFAIEDTAQRAEENIT